jgi:hypothetical protein
MISYRPLALFVVKKPPRINRGGGPDHNLDCNGADDGTGATDIHPRDGNSDSGRRRSRKVCLAGIRD